MSKEQATSMHESLGNCPLCTRFYDFQIISVFTRLHNISVASKTRVRIFFAFNMLEMSRPKILVKRENIEFLEKLEKLTASRGKLVEQRIV